MLISTRTKTQRRGIAMLLVLISLGMATILSMSYLASRDNSALISANIVAAAGQPTPRTVAVWTELTSFGATPAAWETIAAADGHTQLPSGYAHAAQVWEQDK